MTQKQPSSSSARISAAWTRTIPAHNTNLKEKFTEAVKLQMESSVFKRLQQILDEELKELDRSEIGEDSYVNSDWSHRQAHRNGKRQALLLLRELITKREDTNN